MELKMSINPGKLVSIILESSICIGPCETRPAITADMEMRWSWKVFIKQLPEIFMSYILMDAMNNGIMTRWPLDEIGRNSLTPWIRDKIKIRLKDINFNFFKIML